ncbi:hypothetical protein Tco_0568341 [Tanacetum coccineum]
MNWCGITASKAVLEYLALSYEAGDNSDRRSILRILFGPLQLVNKSFDSRKWISGYESLYRLSSLVINTQAHAPSFFVTMIKTVHPMANTGYNSHSPTSLVIDPLTPSIIRCHTIIGAFEIAYLVLILRDHLHDVVPSDEKSRRRIDFPFSLLIILSNYDAIVYIKCVIILWTLDRAGVLTIAHFFFSTPNARSTSFLAASCACLYLIRFTSFDPGCEIDFIRTAILEFIRQEDASKQKRKIEDLDADAEVTLVDETQEMIKDNLMSDTVSAAEAVTTASASVEIPDELTLAQTLIQIKTAKSKLVTTAATTVTSVRPRAKGIIYISMIQERNKVALDEELVRNLKAQLQAKLIKEERLVRQKEEKANIALIKSWDNTQAMMEADFELA